MDRVISETDEEGYSHPKIAIIGAGPTGGILAAHLAKKGETIILVDILKHWIDSIRENGLKVVGSVKLHSRIPYLCYSISELADYNPDVLIIAVKTSALKKVIEEIQKIWQTGMKVVSYQNGMDNELVLAETFGPGNISRVVINYAGNVVGDATIEMTFFNKPNYIGIISEQASLFSKRLAQLMTKAGISVMRSTSAMVFGFCACATFMSSARSFSRVCFSINCFSGSPARSRAAS